MAVKNLLLFPMTGNPPPSWPIIPSHIFAYSIGMLGVLTANGGVC